MKRTRIAALTLTLGLSLGAHAHAQVHLERVPGVFRDVSRSEESVALPLAGDEEGLLVEIGFPFVFYGQTFSQLGVTTNGYVTVGAAVSPDNDALPNAFLPNGVLAPFWDDLDTRPNPDARILMERAGPEGARVLTIQWTGLALKADPAARLTFQVLLFEGTNEVLFHYGPMKNGDGTEGTGLASGASATIGVESPDGQNGVPVSFDTPGVARQGVGFAFLPRAGAPLPEGRRLGDLDGDGEVTILDQSRQVELTSARYRPATALELVAADVAPLDSNDALWGDGTLRVSDRDLISRVIVGRDTLAPYLSDLLPGAVAPLTTLTLIGSGFDPSSAENNVVTLPRAGGGTLSLPATTVNAAGSRLTLFLPADARRGDVFVRVNGRRTNARTLAVQGVPSILALAPTPAVIGEHLAIGGVELPAQPADVRVTIGGLPATVVSLTTGPDTGQGPTRIVTVIVPADLDPSPHPVVVSRLNGASSEPVTHTFGDLPVVAITAPADDADLRDRVTVTGTVHDADLARYELAYAPLEGGDWVTFFTGTEPVTDGALGTFDPTLLLNGYYRLRLRAIDAQGLSAEAQVAVSVQGWLKLGHFTLAFTDLEVPVSGIPIRVVREYDSRRKSVDDFGVGWRLRLVSVDLQESEDGSVILENPVSGRVEYRFEPEQRHVLDPRFFDARYLPRDPQERSAIDFETPEGVFAGNHVLFKDDFGQFFWFPEMIPFDPQVYRVTQHDGTVLRVHDTDDLLQVLEPNGNSITVSRTGISHSAGKSVVFTRDALDRITTVTDPRGNSQTYTYDLRGDLTKHTDREGFSTTFVYALDHHLLEWIDPRGIPVERNEYDDAGRLVATVDPKGHRIEFTHDLEGRREVVRDRLGRPTITEYDARGRAVRIVAADGTQETFTHNERNQVLSRTDRNGSTWTYTYDPAGNQTSQTDPLGNTISYTYDASGRLLTIRDADDGLVQHTYDANGNLTSTTDQLGRVTTRSYDAAGNMTSITSPANEVTRFDYDEFGSLTRRVEPNGRTTLYAVDLNGNATTVTEVVPVPGGPSVRSTTTFEYDRSDLLTRTIYPDGRTTTITYDAGGREASRAESDGRRTVFAYDELGRMAQRIAPDGSAEVREYDPNGVLLAISDPQGRRSCEVDPLGRPTTITFADGSTVENRYDGVGHITTRIDARGNAWSYEYDAAGRRVRETDPLGGETVYGYDRRGNLTSKRDPDGNTTSFVFDAVGRHVETHLPDGTVLTIARDEVGRETSRTDASGRTFTYDYGDYSQRTATNAPVGGVVYTYDTRGNVLTQTDALGRTTSYAYDPVSGRRTSKTLPLGQRATLSYDEAGRLNAVTDFAGATVELEHDGNGRLVFRALPDRTGERLTYDFQGRLERIEDSRGATDFLHDEVGRLLKRREPDGRMVEYAYDGVGNVTSLTTPAGTVVYGYDPANRLTSITDEQGRTTTLEYSPGGTLEAIRRPSGVITEITVDPVGRITRVFHASNAGPIAGYTYEYAAGGNRTRVVEDSGRTVTYEYDAMARLTVEAISDAAGVTSLSYTYDAVGNRLTKTTARPDGTTQHVQYVLDANDRLLREEVQDSAGGGSSYAVTYTYDENGRVLSRAAPDEVASYGYDGIGRLTSAVVVRGEERHEVLYRYDHHGNRVQTVRDGVVTHHLVDANRPYAQVLVDTDAAGRIIATYGYGAQPLYQADASGTTHDLLFDGQLSVRHLVDPRGDVVGSVDFDAFGLPLERNGATSSLSYTGERFDETTGLYYLRSRYLDPRTGRFMTRDTFEGFTNDPPTLNPYVYALQNPVNRIDPAGTYSFFLNCVFAFDLPQAIAEVDRANANRAAVAWEGIDLMRRNIESLYFAPDAVDLIGLDVRATLLALFPRPIPPQGPPRPGVPRIEPAATSLYGAKVVSTLGADVVLSAARSPSGETSMAAQRLEADALAYGRPADPASEPTGAFGETGPAGNLARQLHTWALERQQSGHLSDVRLQSYQVDRSGDQVGWNRPTIQFNVVALDLHVCVNVTSTASVSQRDRIVRNDPRALAIEVDHLAVYEDAIRALLQREPVFGPTLLFFLPPPGNNRRVKEAIPYRNLPGEPPPAPTLVGAGVLAHSGEFILSRVDMRVPGRGSLQWELSRTYRSGLVDSSDSQVILGFNWRLNYDERISGLKGGRDLIELDSTARMIDTYSSSTSEFSEVRRRPDGKFTLVVPGPVGFDVYDETRPGRTRRDAEFGYLRRSPSGIVEKFDGQGWLVEIADPAGNTIKLLRDTVRRLRLAIDTTGRTYRYDYHPQRTFLLTSVTDEASERTVTFEYDERFDLVAAISPEGRREEYTYSSGHDNPVLNHNLLTVKAPREVEDGGPPLLENSYQTAPGFDLDRVLAQRVGGTRTYVTSTGEPREASAGGNYYFTYVELADDGLLRFLDRNTPATVTKVTDRRGKDVTYHFNAGGAPVRVIDEIGSETTHHYNRDGLRTQTTHPDGQVEYLVYDQYSTFPHMQGNLVVRLRFPSPRAPRPAIVERFVHEPLFNRLHKAIDSRGFEPVTEIPDPDAAPEDWLVPTSRIDAFTTTNYFDYQESDGSDLPDTLRLFGIVPEELASAVELEQGDLNDDDVIGGPHAYQGNVVLVRGRTVTLDPFSPEATRLGTTAQVAETRIQYNEFGQPTRVEDAEGNLTTFSYYEDHTTGGIRGYLRLVSRDAEETARRTTASAPARVIETYDYDPFGNVQRHTNGRGTVTEMDWSPDGDLKEIRRAAESLRYVERRGYDLNRNLTAVEIEDRDARDSVAGRFFVSRRDYDILNDVVEEAVQVAPERWLATFHEYDREQSRVRTIQPEGNSTTWTYDARGLVIAKTRGSGSTSTEPSTERWEYNEVRDLRSSTWADGSVTTFEYDGFARTRRIVFPTGAEEVREYDEVSNVIATARRGHRAGPSPSTDETEQNVLLQRTEYVYDEKDRLVLLVQKLFDDEHEPHVDVLQRTTYDRLDRVTHTTGPDGRIVQQTHDGLGRVVQTLDPLGNTIEYTYDPNGNVVHARETHTNDTGGPPEVFDSYFVYDALDRLTRATDSAGQTTYFTYDSRDNQVATADALGPLAPDPLGLVPFEINQPGNVVAFYFDAANRRVREVHELRVGGRGDGAVDTSNPFNEDGKSTLTYEWDDNSRLTAVVDDSGNRTEHTYDDLDRLEARIYPDGSKFTFAYDVRDNVRTATDPNGTVVHYAYDRLGRLTAVNVDRAHGVGGTTHERFEYDGLSRLTFASDDNGEPTGTQWFERAHDSLSRLTSERQNGLFLTHEYNVDGTRRRFVYPGQREVMADYDVNDRPSTVTDPTRGLIASYRYAGPGLREAQRTHGDGTIKTYLDEAGHLVGYDQVERTIKCKAVLPGGATFLEREYEYSRASIRTAETRRDDAALSDRFEYDSLYRLTAARYDQGEDPAAKRRARTAADYLLDGVGNRRQVDHGEGVSADTSTTYEVNSLHQYVNVDGIARTHDRNGNLIDDGRLLYEYDYKNRLIAVRRKAAGQPLVARYRYDSENRRTAKVLFDATGTTVVSDVRFYYDGARICEEQTASGTTLTTYVHGPAHLDDVVQVLRTDSHSLGEATLYVHQDARGNVVALTQPAAGGTSTVVERRFYDDYGAAYDAEKEPSTPPAAQGVAFAFQGQYFDAETGLYYFRARYYDPGTGRFLQRDPVWDPVNLGNPYTFVGNSPITGTDPYGDLAWLAPVAVYLGWAAVNTAVDTVIEFGMSKFFGGEFSFSKSLAVNGVVNLLTGGVGGKILRCAGFAQRVGTRYAANYAARSLGDAAITSGAELLVTGETDPWANVIGGFVGHGIGDIAEVGIRRLVPVCFLAGTMVETREGYKPIESLEVGDEVLSRDERTGEQGYKRVARLFRGHTERVAYVQIAQATPTHQRGRSERHRVGVAASASSDGEESADPDPDPDLNEASGEQTIRSTVGHPYYVVGRGWVHAKDLQAGDPLLGSRGEALVVVGVEIRAESADHYNFEVEGWHTYFVAGEVNAPAVWVHNRCREAMWRDYQEAGGGWSRRRFDRWFDELEAGPPSSGFPGHRSGHHVPGVRKAADFSFAVSRADLSRPVFFFRGDAATQARSHWMLHHAERPFVGPRQGAFPGTAGELFNAHRWAYKHFDDIRVDVRSPDGSVLLGRNLTPSEGLDRIQIWLMQQGLH